MLHKVRHGLRMTESSECTLQIAVDGRQRDARRAALRWAQTTSTAGQDPAGPGSIFLFRTGSRQKCPMQMTRPHQGNDPWRFPCMPPGLDRDRSASEAAGLRNTRPPAVRLFRMPCVVGRSSRDSQRPGAVLGRVCRAGAGRELTLSMQMSGKVSIMQCAAIPYSNAGVDAVFS